MIGFGVYLHGLAGDLAASKYGEIPMTASDLIASIPDAYAQVLGNGMRCATHDAEQIVTVSAEETLVDRPRARGAFTRSNAGLAKGRTGRRQDDAGQRNHQRLGGWKEEEVTSPTFTLVHVFQKRGEISAETKTAPQNP